MRKRPPAHPLVFVVVVVAILGLLALGRRSGITPIRAATDRVLSPIESGVDYVRSFAAIKRQNDELRLLATRLAIENFYLKEYRFENRRLRRLLEFRDETRFDLVPARVIARTGGRGAETWRLDKGGSDSIKPGMAVVTHRGLVGRIDEVRPQSASVRTLRNQDVRVSAVAQRSRVVGILVWQFPRGFRLRDVPSGADLRVGDRVVSSGLGGVFPPGIPLGRVRESRETRGQIFRDVVLEPDVDFSLLEEVYVVQERGENTGGGQEGE